jgi:hypothetical protein
MSGFYHPSSEIEWVALTVNPGVPVQVKATATKCRGILIPPTDQIILIGDAVSQPLYQSASFPPPVYIPIDDASKIWVDVAAGVDVAVGVAIFK